MISKVKRSLDDEQRDVYNPRMCRAETPLENSKKSSSSKSRPKCNYYGTGTGMIAVKVYPIFCVHSRTGSVRAVILEVALLRSHDRTAIRAITTYFYLPYR